METSENIKSDLVATNEITAEPTGVDETFLKACEDSDASNIEKILKQGITKEKINLGMHEVVHKSQDSARSVRCLEVLLSHGADLESKVEGNTLLILAARKGDPVVMAWLLEKGADMGQVDFEGNTALHILSQNKGESALTCSKVLIEAGASLSTSNKANRTAIEEAEFAGNDEMRSLFESFINAASKDQPSTVIELGDHDNGSTVNSPAAPTIAQKSETNPIQPRRTISASAKDFRWTPPPRSLQPQPNPVQYYPPSAYPPPQTDFPPQSFWPDPRYKPIISNENGLPVLQLDISTPAAQANLILWAKYEKVNDERMKINQDIQLKTEALNLLQSTSQGELQRISDECKKIESKIQLANTRIQAIEQDIVQANIANSAIWNSIKASGSSEAELEGESEERLKLKFSVTPLNEREVIRQLESEIEEFHKWVVTQAKQLRPIRQRLIDDLSHSIHQLDPDLYIDIYGSYAAELCLPSSDIDLVVISNKNQDIDNYSTQILENIKSLLNTKSWLKSVNIIKSAAMPVIKLECTGELNYTKVDISVKDSRHKGLECVKVVKQYISRYESLKKLLLVFKYIVKLGGLNDPYLVYFGEASIRNKYELNETLPPMGRLLLEIMRFYAEFDFWGHQIRPKLPHKHSPGPIFLEKHDKDGVPTVIDPLITNTVNNVAKCTYRINDIQDLLRAVLQTVLTDCTCAKHRRSTWTLYPYEKRLMQFWDHDHSLVCRMFAAAVSLRQYHNNSII